MTHNPREAAVHTGGRASARRCVVTTTVLVVFVALATRAAANARDTSVAVREDDGVYHVTATFSVTQPAAVALATLTDYARIPRFMPEVRASQVLESSAGRAVVEQEAVARFMMFSKRIHLVLEVQEERGAIQFRDRCGTSFARYEGAWNLAEQAGVTTITYELSAKPTFEVPEFLLKRLLKRDATQMIERLKVEIGARAMEGPADRGR